MSLSFSRQIIAKHEQSHIISSNEGKLICIAGGTRNVFDKQQQMLLCPRFPPSPLPAQAARRRSPKQQQQVAKSFSSGRRTRWQAVCGVVGIKVYSFSFRPRPSHFESRKSFHLTKSFPLLRLLR